ncbi:Fe2+ or Zn2+ uptake regulation protein [Pseudoclavibacter chungangensis]|nr:transcriptional repressor [Pseudoclavibacter chungangensis]NYJ65326.1 Fe2+ or Zn2+ uptake regulation protein [Pseudoclavibacter chungangensis]
MPTLQTRTVLATLARLGHASNLELHDALVDQLPDLSLQSVHRITARLLERGQIGSVPSDGRGAILDTRPEPHDHFVCTKCGGIVDITIPPSALDAIQAQLGTHLASDGLVVRGTCAVCRTAATSPATPAAEYPPKDS